MIFARKYCPCKTLLLLLLLKRLLTERGEPTTKESPPGQPILCDGLHMVCGDVELTKVSQDGISPPRFRAPGVTTPAVSTRIEDVELAGRAGQGTTKQMAEPGQTPMGEADRQRWLASTPPDFMVGDEVEPPNADDLTLEFQIKGDKFAGLLLRACPGFGPIHQHGEHSSVVDPHLGLDADLMMAPKRPGERPHDASSLSNALLDVNLAITLSGDLRAQVEKVLDKLHLLAFHEKGRRHGSAAHKHHLGLSPVDLHIQLSSFITHNLQGTDDVGP